MATFNISWNITSATLEWSNVTVTHYNDGTTTESGEPQSRDLTFTPNESFTDEKKYTETVTFQDQTVIVEIIQAPKPKEVVDTTYEIRDLKLVNLKA